MTTALAGKLLSVEPPANVNITLPAAGRVELTWSVGEDYAHDTCGCGLIRADVMRSTDVTDVSELAAAAAAAAAARKMPAARRGR